MSDPIYQSNDLQRFSGDGESDFSNDFPCILTRISLTITAQQALYTLPDNVRSIRRISWQGVKIAPLGQRNMREVFNNPTQVGTPYWYIFNNVGQNCIQFFPIPPTNVSPSGLNLYGDAIPTDVIVEYFIQPDGVNYSIPYYFRRRLLKQYIQKMAYSIEGPGQNLKMSQYYNKKWEFLKDKYGNFLYSIHNKSRKLCLNGITSSQFFPGSPILPVARFGVGITDDWS